MSKVAALLTMLLKAAKPNFWRCCFVSKVIDCCSYGSQPSGADQSKSLLGRELSCYVSVWQFISRLVTDLVNSGAYSCSKGVDNPVQHAPGASRAVPLVFAQRRRGCSSRQAEKAQQPPRFPPWDVGKASHKSSLARCKDVAGLGGNPMV